MNYPTITCYVSVKNTHMHEIELINAFRKLGYEPFVNSLEAPSYEKIKSAKNTIVYVWTDEYPSYSISKNFIALPSEHVTKDADIAAIQTHPKFISLYNRTVIGNYNIELMTTSNTPKSKRLLLLSSQGCFSTPTTLVSNEVHEPRHVIIKDGVERDAGDLNEFVTEEFKKFFNK